MRRFYIAPEKLTEIEVIIRGDEFKHLAFVLRLKPEEEVYLFDGEGREYKGLLKRVDKDHAVVELVEQLAASRESPLQLYLVQGIAKGEKMDLVIQKATELGVCGVIPLQAERSIVRLSAEKKEERRERWQRVALEAAKQCRRTKIPAVASPQSLEEYLQGLPEERLLLIPWEEGGTPLKTVLSDPAMKAYKDKQIHVLIGPEGGWEFAEVARVLACGAVAVSLGPRILRTETASIATLAVIMHQWGDLG